MTSTTSATTNRTGMYYCHYCDEIVEVADDAVEHRPGGYIDWVCPVCGYHNDGEAVEYAED